MLDRIYAHLQEMAPLETCESWDNSGLLVRGDQPVEKVLLTLDITSEVVEEAAKGGYQLIVAHHPVIFRGIKQLGHSDVVFKLARHNISAICMHTNLDAAAGGVNDVLAEITGLKDIEPFEEIGRIGIFEPAKTVAELAKDLSDKLATTVKYTLPEKMVHTVAMIGGSAGEFWEQAKAAGADVFLSGEASHHHALDAKEADIAIIVGGHWNTESPVLIPLKEDLQKAFPDVVFDIANTDQDPYSYVG